MLSLSAVTAFALPQYTGFTTRSTGYVVTASNWNDEFQNFINHMNTHLIGTFNLLLGAKGKIMSSDSSTIGVLTNAGAGDDNKVLTLDSAQTLGLKWSTPANQIIENKDCSGRLTVTSNNPVPALGVASASTIYFTPYQGNTIDLYEGSQWKKHTFTQITISLSGLTAERNYDVFIYDSDANDTADASDLVIWTDATNRATALATQDGVFVKTGATSRRYVGTVRMTNTTGVTADESQNRLVWNYYNRIDRNFIAGLSTDSWTYGTDAWRVINNNSAAGASLVIGVNEEIFDATYYAVVSGGGDDAAVGIGKDSFTANSANIFQTHSGSSNNEFNAIQATYYEQPGIGFHTFYPIERVFSGNNVTFYGDNDGQVQSGMRACMRM